MAIIKTLKESKIVSKGRPRQTIYPVTSSDAVIVPNKGKLTEVLSKVAFSNDYNDLDNLPTSFNVEIPTNISAFNNDVGYLTSFTETDPTVPSWAKQSTKPSYSYNEISGTPTLANVATSGSYNDLSNKPTIPTVPTNVSAFTNDVGYLTQHQSLTNYYTKPEVNSAIANYTPIIEDTRSSAVAAITGVAPFNTLVDGQKIVVKLKYTTSANATLTLTGLTNALPIYARCNTNNNSGITPIYVNGFVASSYMELIYDATNSRWICTNYDRVVTYEALTQSRIDSSSTAQCVITGKLLRDNFYLKSEINATIGDIETLLTNI